MNNNLKCDLCGSRMEYYHHDLVKCPVCKIVKRVDIKTLMLEQERKQISKLTRRELLPFLEKLPEYFFLCAQYAQVVSKPNATVPEIKEIQLKINNWLDTEVKEVL